AKHTARDLDALAPLARCRKEIDLLERFPRRRRRGGKHILTNPIEAVRTRRFDRLHVTERPQRVERRSVADGNGSAGLARSLDERGDERALRATADLNVQQQQRTTCVWSSGRHRSLRRGAEKSRAVDSRCGLKLRFEPLEKIGEIGSALRQPPEIGGRCPGERELLERS